MIPSAAAAVALLALVAGNPGPALDGTPVTGTADPAQAPALATGRYVDVLPEESPSHYRLPRTERGSTFHVSALFVGTGGSTGEGIRLEIGTTPGDQGCGGGGAFRPTLGETDPLVFAAVTTWTDVTDHACTVADELHLTLDVPPDPADAGREVQLLVYEEPPLSTYSLGLLPPPETISPHDWTTLEPARNPPGVEAGSTPTNAPVVGDGSHRITLQPRQSRVLAIPLDWDQSLQAQLDLTVPADAPDPNGISIEILGPLLGTSQVSFADDPPADWTGEAPVVRIGARSHVVSYLNRDSYDTTVNTEALAGMHFVMIRWTTTDTTTDPATIEVPATVTLRTTGTSADGEPAYAATSTLPAPQADSRLVDGSLTGPSTPATGTTGDAASDTASDGDTANDRPLLVAALVAAAVALGAALFAGLRRRR